MILLFLIVHSLALAEQIKPQPLILEWDVNKTPVLKAELGPQAESWWKKVCPGLGQRLTYGSGPLGTGPFEKTSCQFNPGAPQKNSSGWHLNVIESEGQLSFNITKDSTIQVKISILASGANKEFLQKSEILALMALGLADQLPFLGYVTAKNIVKNTIFLQYKTSSAAGGFVPEKLIFYTLQRDKQGDSFQSHVYVIVKPEFEAGKYVVNSSILIKGLRKEAHAWFHNPDGLGKKFPTIQKKLLDLQAEAIKTDFVKDTAQAKDNEILVRIGKQVINYELLRKVWLVDFEADVKTKYVFWFAILFRVSTNRNRRHAKRHREIAVIKNGCGQVI